MRRFAEVLGVIVAAVDAEDRERRWRTLTYTNLTVDYPIVIWTV